MSAGDGGAWPLHAVDGETFAAFKQMLEPHQRAWIEANGFVPKAENCLVLPTAAGGIAGAVVGVEKSPKLWRFAALRHQLPLGRWRFAEPPSGIDPELVQLGWRLGAYRFARYRQETDAKPLPELEPPSVAAGESVERMAAAIDFGRDLINTPANDLGPEELARAAAETAARVGASFDQVVGDDLLKRDFGSIHAVGKGSARAPRLIDLAWGDPAHPRVTLIGKGVCFDSGGLDLKTAEGMRLMKKDMGGAATVLALFRLVAESRLAVRLRCLVPAVENSVSGRAFRPGDVIRTRRGLSVEVGNTDAEGRIILSDALTLADDERPDLMIDIATLTGAARVALGPELPALFTDDDSLADGLLGHGREVQDPLWRMPLHAPYAKRLDSPVADMNNVSDGPMAGAVTAALFLKAFVKQTKSWAHIDTFAWNDREAPGRPKGGETLTLRAIFALLARRYPAR
ncbi:MAG: leucyl aminopeptidase family protein [Alphaproteobacteria bacterium]|nr:leucyl aminopeptidase family protein [Alphaproteobacteria bacterium]